MDYAQAARAGERHLSAKACVLALQHEAHGHAMTGDRAAADRLLDTAATLTGRIDDEFPWGNACSRTPHYVEVQRATCYGRTGSRRDSADAVSLWDEILGAMPESARRDNAVFAARQATALAAIPDPKRVAAIAATAAGAVTATGSARLRRELLVLPSLASGWASSAAGQQRLDIVASVA
jgi:hypothetical protein